MQSVGKIYKWQTAIASFQTISKQKPDVDNEEKTAGARSRKRAGDGDEKEFNVEKR